MPLYEFECQNCHHRFEKIQSVADPDPACVKCGGTVERLLHAPAVQFKGSGWYVTDYGRSGASGAKSDSKSGDKPDSGSGTKSESKTESTKSESKTSGASKD